MINRILTCILIFIFAFNPNYLSAEILKNTYDIQKTINCDLEKKNFLELNNCLNSEFSKNNNLNKKQKKTLLFLISTSNAIKSSLNANFIDESLALDSWQTIINSSVKSKKSKLKIKQIVNSTKCKNNVYFNSFINCFYKEFRNLDVYQSSNLKTKERIEFIVANSLLLQDDKNWVVLTKKYEGHNLEKIYMKDEAFPFFYQMMNGLGTDFFEKEKLLSRDEIKKIITFIIIAIIISMVAQKIISKQMMGKSSSSANAPATSSSASASKYTSAELKTLSMTGKNFYKYPSLRNKTWFKYVYRSAIF